MTALLLRLFARADRWVTRYVAKPARSVSPVNPIERIGTFACCDGHCRVFFGPAGCGELHREPCPTCDRMLGDTGEITVRGAVVITALWIAFAWAMTALGTAWTGVQ